MTEPPQIVSCDLEAFVEGSNGEAVGEGNLSIRWRRVAVLEGGSRIESSGRSNTCGYSELSFSVPDGAPSPTRRQIEDAYRHHAEVIIGDLQSGPTESDELGEVVEGLARLGIVTTEAGLEALPKSITVDEQAIREWESARAGLVADRHGLR